MESKRNSRGMGVFGSTSVRSYEFRLRIGSFLKNKFLAALTEKKDKLLVKRVHGSL